VLDADLDLQAVPANVSMEAMVVRDHKQVTSVTADLHEPPRPGKVAGVLGVHNERPIEIVIAVEQVGRRVLRASCQVFPGLQVEAPAGGLFRPLLDLRDGRAGGRAGRGKQR
jgi:hypothetical protein